MAQKWEAPSANIQAPEKLQEPNSNAAGRALLAGKLRRFFFEQRSRVLSKLSSAANNICPTSPTGLTSPTPPALDELFELATENAKLLARLQLPMTEHTATEINQATLSALTQTWQESLSATESIEQLRDRIRRLYNHAAAERAKEIAARLCP